MKIPSLWCSHLSCGRKMIAKNKYTNKRKMHLFFFFKIVITAMKNIKRERIGKVRPELTFNEIIRKGYTQKLALEKRYKVS